MGYSVRKPFADGLFYPKDNVTLNSMITDILSHADRIVTKRIPRLIIVPHAGFEYSGQVA